MDLLYAILLDFENVLEYKPMGNEFLPGTDHAPGGALVFSCTQSSEGRELRV